MAFLALFRKRYVLYSLMKHMLTRWAFLGAAMGRIYKEIGFGGLWNGLPVRIVMIGTLTGLQWMIYVSA